MAFGKQVMEKEVFGTRYRWHLGRLEVLNWRMSWQTSAYNSAVIELHLNPTMERTPLVQALYDAFSSEIK